MPHFSQCLLKVIHCANDLIRLHSVARNVLHLQTFKSTIFCLNKSRTALPVTENKGRYNWFENNCFFCFFISELKYREKQKLIQLKVSLISKGVSHTHLIKTLATYLQIKNKASNKTVALLLTVV